MPANWRPKWRRVLLATLVAGVWFRLLDGGPFPARLLAYTQAASLLVHVTTGGPGAEAVLATLAAGGECNSYWLAALLRDEVRGAGHRQADLRQYLRCTNRDLSMVALRVGDDRALARLAASIRPNNGAAWFWIADTLTYLGASTMPETETDRSPAIQAYLAGLQADPVNSQRWRELGDLLTPRDPAGATSAYLQSCIMGDKGYNGCWRAGQSAERMGESQSAIRYYRMSLWGRALQRASELEAMLRDRTIGP